MTGATALSTEGVRVTFGKHNGQLFTRLPVGYLRWMVGNDAPQARYAKAELSRRGTTEITVEISAHAIDRASQRVLHVWQKTREGDEGLHAWLHRYAAQACEESSADKVGHQKLPGVKFVFDRSLCVPVLKSVIYEGGAS